MRDIQIAMDDVASSSHRAAAFLIAFGTTWIVCGLRAYRLPAKDLALAVIFQGAVALPMASLHPRRLFAELFVHNLPILP